jgi:NADH pyrophosphatase NudC (nudix superfamily)
MQKSVQKTQRLELVTGIKFCPKCLSKNIETTETDEKCKDCGLVTILKDDANAW